MSTETGWATALEIFKSRRRSIYFIYRQIPTTNTCQNPPVNALHAAPEQSPTTNPYCCKQTPRTLLCSTKTKSKQNRTSNPSPTTPFFESGSVICALSLSLYNCTSIRISRVHQFSSMGGEYNLLSSPEHINPGRAKFPGYLEHGTQTEAQLSLSPVEYGQGVWVLVSSPFP